MSNKRDIWVCTPCQKEVSVDPDDYTTIGMPYCADCDCEMECRLPEKKECRLPEKDACQFCLGAKGGTPGNENIIGGVILCDDCHALLCQMEEKGGITIGSFS